MINLLLNIIPYQNGDKKSWYIFNVTYFVCYYLVKFELKTPLVHGETKKTNYAKV
jgi:hypothetical protein